MTKVHIAVQCTKVWLFVVVSSLLALESSSSTSVQLLLPFQMSSRERLMREIDDYLRTSDGQNSIDTGFDAHESRFINVLLLGRAQVGKTTFALSLTNPSYSSHLRVFSDTTHVTHRGITIRDKRNEKYYQINMIDTIGLSEHSRNAVVNRSDQEILDLAAEFIEREITTLNVVIFVSKMGDHLTDLPAFRLLIAFLGPSFKKNTMMLLTHADGFSQERIEEHIHTVRTDASSRDIAEYCQLGIFSHGTLSIDQLETMQKDDHRELRVDMVKNKLEQITPMRTRILELFIEQHGRQQPVTQLQELINRANQLRNEAIREEIEARAKMAASQSNCVIL